jgi:hypothetical protein
MLPDFGVSGTGSLERIEDQDPLMREVWLVVRTEIKDMPRSGRLWKL